MDCTVITFILRRRFDSICIWPFSLLSGLAESAYAGFVYIDIFYGVLQIPQYVASKGIVKLPLKEDDV